MKVKEINGKNYMDAKVVTLPTKKDSLIYLEEYYKDTITLFYNLSDKLNKYTVKRKNQHIYVVSNENPTKGDWILSDKNKIHKVLYIEGDKIIFKVPLINEAFLYNNECIKIIATTDKDINEPDPKLKDITYALLPEPNKEFIQSYIEAYNIESPITDILIEVESKNECDCYYTKFCKSTQLEKGTYCRDSKNKPYTLKINAGNTINIKSKEEKSYTKKELLSIFEKTDGTGGYIPHWINKNL